MDSRTLSVLEFPKILSIISDFASTGPGSSACTELLPMTDPDEISRILNTITEIREIYTIEGNIPMGGINDVLSLLSRINVEGTYLSPHEMIDIGANISAYRKIKAFLSALTEKYPLSAEIVSPLIELKQLEEDIEKTFGPKGEILDDASPNLRDIRKKSKKKKEEINRILSGMLNTSGLTEAIQENLITMRNERYVIPIKADFVGRIPGIVHDRSQSGATLFVEPLKTVDANNNLSSLKRDEEDEEIRILRHLSNLIKERAEDILSNHKIVIVLDTLLARAKAADAMGAIVPEIDKKGELLFEKATHPLLSHSIDESGRHTFKNPKVVPIDISIGGEVRLVVLSGANTGGKTVALKTLGLLSLMFMTGIPIPVAEGSRVVPFKKIFADIGDEQDIEGSLSTFSAKLETLKTILSNAGSGSLVLIDEIMTGTDPEQGSALAIASLDYLSKKNATILVTTHLNSLKAYALNSNDAQNVSVVFDDMKNVPLYKLLYGIPGGSNAIMIAQNLNIPAQVIETAKENLGEEGERLGSLIARLEREMINVSYIKNGIEDIKGRLLKLEEEFTLLLDKIREKRNEIIESFRFRFTEILKTYEDSFKDIFSRTDTPGIKKGKLHEEFHETKRSLLAELPKKEKITPSSDELSVGDTVSIRGYALKGKLIEISGNRVEVDMGGRKVSVNLGELKKESHTPEKKFSQSLEHHSEPKTEVNVIGLTIEDAIPLVDKAIDNALLGGLMRIDIIHGLGTGRLRKAIRNHLSEHSQVKAVKTEIKNDGVTTAELL